MAASEVDQKLLGRLSKEMAVSNPLLSSALYQVLGLSVLLSRWLFRARKLRKLDTTRDTKSLSLYHRILWLSREGLSITEVFILPYSQDSNQGSHCRIMAAKLRASFYHVFCLFHNNPPISQFSPLSKSSPNGPLTPRANNGQNVLRQSPIVSTRERKAALRDAIPSMVSEASYVTNPFASEGPAMTPPPSYPVPPIPSAMSPSRRTPTRPPGLSTPSLQISPTSNANFLLPPLDFVPTAKKYFSIASSLARDLLERSDLLRLSTALEHSAFLWDCAKDFDAARLVAKSAIQDVYAAPEAMEDTEFEDATFLVKALGAIAARGDVASANRSIKTQDDSRPTTRVKPVAGLTSRDDGRSPLSRSTTARSRSSQPLTRKAAGRSRTMDDGGLSGTEGRSPTLIGSPVTATNIPIAARDGQSSTDPAKGRTSSSKGKQRRRSPIRELSEKERKRRLVERAEEEISRRNSAGTTGQSRQATPPHMVGEEKKRRIGVVSKEM